MFMDIDRLNNDHLFFVVREGRGMPPSVMESKHIVNFKDPTDGKSAFRQWDLKLVNAVNYMQPGYGKALDKLKEFIDRGVDPEDARPGAASEINTSHFGTVLIENPRDMKHEALVRINIEQLEVDIEFIMI